MISGCLLEISNWPAYMVYETNTLSSIKMDIGHLEVMGNHDLPQHVVLVSLQHRNKTQVGGVARGQVCQVVHSPAY